MFQSTQTTKQNNRAQRLKIDRSTDESPGAQEKIASVIDVYCGVGCLSHGFHLEGFEVECGIDIDESCGHAFEFNNEAEFLSRDVFEMSANDIYSRFDRTKPTVLVGCAPCQPFSQYNVHNNDPKWELVDKLADLIVQTHPDVVSMENVPQLVRFKKGRTFRSLLNRLKSAGYRAVWEVLDARDYGVPQSRHRLVLIASRIGNPSLPTPTTENDKVRSVHDSISHLPSIRAGEIDASDPLHRSRKLSALNLRRIQASKAGGSWHDWDRELLPNCYTKSSGRHYTAVYGRMNWSLPAPTLTTQFMNYGSGRYGHPVQDRAISLREGALLQTIPENYKLTNNTDAINFTTLGRMIGNAVPVELARSIARAIADHIESET